MRRLSCFVLLLISSVHVDARHKMDQMPRDEGQSKLIKELGLLSTEVCQNLPSESKAKCLESADAYVRRTGLLVKGIFNEESLCNSTGVCILKSMFLTINGIASVSDNSTEVTDEHTCTACRQSVKDIFTRLNHPKMRMKVMESLIEYCEEMEDYVRECKEKVYEFAPKVLSKLAKAKTSDLCRMMGFCDEEIL